MDYESEPEKEFKEFEKIFFLTFRWIICLMLVYDFMYRYFH
jgi:hypothetical protein